MCVNIQTYNLIPSLKKLNPRDMVWYSQMNEVFSEMKIWSSQKTLMKQFLSNNDIVLLFEFFSAFVSAKGKDLVMLTTG